MATHFLLTAAARTISLREVFRMSEDAAWEQFKLMRWPETNGEAVCPRCGSHKTYKLSGQRRWKCANGACWHKFSVTSGTLLHGRKMSFVDLMAAVVIMVNGAKGVSALQLARDLDCQHKTAFVLAHKIREAMASEFAGLDKLEDTVEVDGAYFGGHIRPANHKKNRKDRRLAQHQTGKRRVVVVARQRKGRTMTTVTLTEADGVKFVEAVVARGSDVHADEASHWDALHAKFLTWRINHSEAYSKGGACTNQAESFLARLRRMVGGQHHHVSPQHLHAYATHAAWMEDHRRRDNGRNVGAALGLTLNAPSSSVWRGYWQPANHRISVG